MPKVCVDVCVCVCVCACACACASQRLSRLQACTHLPLGLSLKVCHAAQCRLQLVVLLFSPRHNKTNKCGLSATSFISCQAATRVMTLRQLRQNNHLNSDVYFHPKLDLGTKHVPTKVWVKTLSTTSSCTAPLSVPSAFLCPSSTSTSIIGQ